MLHDFKAKAIDSLDIRPNCDDLALLFDIEKKDLVIDDAVKKIGFDVLYFYLKKKKDIYRIPEDHHDRKRFEGLFGAGLAIKGDGIPLETMLTSLKIKEMSSLVQDLNPPKFSKREIAIEFMNNLPDAKNRIESNIGFDSFFQIQESPEVLKDVDMDKLNLSIRYAEEISYIIGETYLRAGHAFSGIGSGKGYSNMGAIKGMKIEIIDDERCCPYCKRMANKAYPKAQCPKTPLHIGCRCTVVPLHEDEEKMLERFI